MAIEDDLVILAAVGIVAYLVLGKIFPEKKNSEGKEIVETPPVAGTAQTTEGNIFEGLPFGPYGTIGSVVQGWFS